MDLFISTSPFGLDPTILEPLKRPDFPGAAMIVEKTKARGIARATKNCKALVAGTENLLPLIKINPDLKMIARVGIGLTSPAT